MIQIRLLGGLGLKGSDGGSVLSVLSQPKRMGLLAFLLAARPRGFHSREKLLALFWPDADEGHARNSLRQAVHFLRKSLGDEAILSRGEEIAVNDALFRSDVSAFDQAIEGEDWRGALDVYGGPFLEGFHVTGAQGFDRWMEVERERFRSLASKGAERLSAELEAAGDLIGAAEAAQRGVHLAPANGGAVQRLMALLARRGDRAGAMVVYETFKARLTEDFGLEPSAELKAAAERIREVAGYDTGAPPQVSKNMRKEAEGDHSPISSSFAPLANEVLHPSTLAVPGPGVKGPRRTGLTGPRVGMAVLVFVLALGIWWAAGVLGPDADGRTPVFLVPDDPGAHNAQEEFLAGLRSKIGLAMEGSRVVRVGSADEWEFMLLVFGGGDSIRFSLKGRDPESERLAKWMYPFPEALTDQAIATLSSQAVKRVGRELTGEEASGSPMDGTANSQAFIEYSAARDFWEERSPRMFFRVVERFRAAVDMDPGYALAFAGLADVYNILGAYDYGLQDPKLAHGAAKAAADSAYALAPDLAEALTALATTKFFYEWDFSGAEELFLDALEQDGEYVHARHQLGLLHAAKGDFDDASNQIDRAIQIDSSEVLLAARGRVHYFAGRYDEAISAYTAALTMEPEFTPALLGRALTAIQASDYETAGRDLDDANAALAGSAMVVTALRGHLAGLRGDATGVEEALETLRAAEDQGDFVPPEYFAMVNLGRGYYNDALANLSEAFANGSNAMTILRVDPLLDPLRGDPVFQALVEKVRDAGRGP